MPTEQEAINSFNELTDVLVKKVWFPTLYDLALERRRAELVQNIPRSNENVDGLQVHVPYLMEIPWAWRAMSEFGYTPTGSKYDATEGVINLGCHASNAIVSLHEITTSQDSDRWTNIINKNMRWIGQTLPYYMRGILWSSKDSKHAIGKVDSVSGTTVTLSTSGLWYSQTGDVAKLFEPGMYIQAYRSDSKVGEPMKVDDVDKKSGTIEVSADPGLSSGDLLTFSDVGGLDQPYDENVPGILDVIDDDNVFQGIDRSASGNRKFRSVIQDASGETLNYGLLKNFFHDCYDPEVAHTSLEIVKKYWTDNIQSGVRYTPGGMYVDGKGEGVQIDGTFLQIDDDIPAHEIIVTDDQNWQIADRGGIENLFQRGWERVPQRPYLSYDVVYWFTLMAEDTRYFGRLHSITEAA